MSESMSPEELSNYYLTWAGVRAESYKVVFVPEENDDGEYEGGYIAFVVDHLTFDTWTRDRWIQAAHDATAFGMSGLPMGNGIHSYYFGWPAPNWMMEEREA